jgi:hypothetical protein
MDRLPLKWPGKKGWMPALTYMRLLDEYSAFALRFSRMSRVQKKRNYPALRHMFNSLLDQQNKGKN